MVDTKNSMMSKLKDPKTKNPVCYLSVISKRSHRIARRREELTLPGEASIQFVGIMVTWWSECSPEQWTFSLLRLFVWFYPYKVLLHLPLSQRQLYNKCLEKSYLMFSWAWTYGSFVTESLENPDKRRNTTSIAEKREIFHLYESLDYEVNEGSEPNFHLKKCSPQKEDRIIKLNRMWEVCLTRLDLSVEFSAI